MRLDYPIRIPLKASLSRWTCQAASRIAGTRSPVGDTLEHLGGGMSEDKILEHFPALTHDDLLSSACSG